MKVCVLKLFSGKKYFYPLIASEINLCKVAQCLKATLNFFCFNYQ